MAQTANSSASERASPQVADPVAQMDHEAERNERMTSALTCPILDEPFTVDGKYRPYVLPCGHTISRQALEKVCEQGSTVDGRAQLRR